MCSIDDSGQFKTWMHVPPETAPVAVEAHANAALDMSLFEAAKPKVLHCVASECVVVLVC